MKGRTLYVVLVVGAFVAAACGGGDDDASSEAERGGSSGLPAEMKIGVPLDMSGVAPLATVGLAEQAGIELAVDEINESDFLGSTDIELVTVDTEGDEQAAVEASLEFASSDVSAVVGFTVTPSFLAAAPNLQNAEIPTMTVMLSGPGVTEAGDYMFRLMPDLGIVYPQNDVIFAETFEAETAAYLTQSDLGTATQILDARKEALEDIGVETVAEESITSTDTDIRAQLTAIKDADPDLVVVSQASGLIPILFLQADEVGLESQIIFGTGTSDEVLSQAGSAMQCAVWTDAWDALADTGNNPHFLEVWGEANGDTNPNSFSALGYGAMWSVAEAIKEAGSADGPAIRDALASLEAIDTPVGTVNLGDDRDAGLEGVNLQIQDSEVVLWDPAAPCTTDS